MQLFPSWTFVSFVAFVSFVVTAFALWDGQGQMHRAKRIARDLRLLDQFRADIMIATRSPAWLKVAHKPMISFSPEA